jgi:hypothetical protein
MTDKTNIDSSIKDLLDKRVYFDYKGNCCIGYLKGIENNQYLIEYKNKIIHLPLCQSLSKI